MKSFLFFVLAMEGIGYSTAGPQQDEDLQPRVISGYRCATTEVPYFVLMETKIQPKSHCGGALITYRWVLTAAHCIRPKLLHGGSAKIHSGFDMPPSLRQVRNAKEFYTHPKFVVKDFLNYKDFRNDIALILVDKPFRRSIVTHVATLPVPGFARTCNQVMTPGIGLTYNKEYVWSKPLKQRPLKCVDLSIVNNDSCKSDYAKGRGKILFDDTVMCTHQSGRGICKGDSGGPVLCEDILIGIVSYGPVDCESTEIANTFTMVESQLDFIRNTIKYRRIK